MQYSVENLVGFLYRSKLLPPESVRAAHDRWLAEGGEHVKSATHFARWLAMRQILTEYQANLLLMGLVDEFFLNDYKVLDRLGRGRMAGVYKAVHTSGQSVAIKVLPPSHAKNPMMLARFQREARLALKLKHPHVVRSFQIGLVRELNYLVMEHLEGETLDEVLQRRKKLPPGEGVRLIYQALLGLQHIHEAGMVHRDLKPSNLMLVSATGKPEPEDTAKTLVKILDIGLGRELFDESLPESLRNPQLTSEGAILGTPDYLAPEQARDPRNADIRADIYSLGCVLYHVLTGQPPFPDKNLLNQIVRHSTEPARPLKEFNPAIPDGLQQIVNWMMAKKPEQRYPTPERAAKALQVFLLAESEPVRRDDPSLNKYLTWLETSQPAPDAAESKSVERAPDPPPRPAPRPADAKPVDAKPPEKAKPRPAAAGSGSQKKAMPARPAKMPSKRGSSPDLAAARPAAARPSPAPVAQPAPIAQPAAIAEEFDVELVQPTEMAGPRPGLLASLGLTPRDWILLGIGSGAVMLLTIVILLIVVLLR